MWQLDCKESWALRNWFFWTVVLEKTLESPLDCKEIKAILKEISPECSLEGLMLKLQYFGHLMGRTDLLEKPWCWERLKAGWEGDDRWCDGWMASLTRWTWVWGSSRCCWWTGKPGVLQSMGSQSVENNWETELNWVISTTLSSGSVIHSSVIKFTVDSFKCVFNFRFCVLQVCLVLYIF